ncbi:MAG: Fe-S-containing protein [Propionibacteriaceae bacterium]|nr:Fe-S-containing protein [Propionibacteriaceae bacterium]
MSVIQAAAPAVLLVSLLWIWQAARFGADCAITQTQESRALGLTRRLFASGVAAGIAAALALAVLRETTTWINRELVSMWSAVAIVVLTLLTLVLSVLKVGRGRICAMDPATSRRMTGKAVAPADSRQGALVDGQPNTHALREVAGLIVVEPIIRVVFAMLSAVVLFAALPAAFLQFTSFLVPGQPVFSTDTLLRVVGFLLGTITVAMGSFAFAKAGEGLSRRLAFVLLIVGAVVYAAWQVVVVAQVLFSRRLIKLSHDAFMALVWAVNHQGIVLFVLTTLALVGAVACLRANRRPIIPADANAAQTRLAKAHALSKIRFACLALLGVGAIIFAVTVGAWLNEYTPELSEPEPFTISNGQAIVPLEDVSDGHMHRFAYVTSDGIEVRFIVVMRNGVSYGVGLDACEICGATGYYERDGNIICRLCDVIMNIATIGFRGGCNPIPLGHQIIDGQLIIDLDDLESVSHIFA